MYKGNRTKSFHVFSRNYTCITNKQTKMLLGSKLFSDFFQQDSCLALCISAVQALCSLAGQVALAAERSRWTRTLLKQSCLTWEHAYVLSDCVAQIKCSLHTTAWQLCRWIDCTAYVRGPEKYSGLSFSENQRNGITFTNKPKMSLIACPWHFIPYCMFVFYCFVFQRQDFWHA